MIDVVDTVDEGFADIDMQKPTSELYKEHAADYETVGKAIAEEYGVTVHTGTTGKLSEEVIFSDPNLRTLQLPSTRSTAGLGLDKVLFAIDELGITKLGRFDPAKPNMWQNIGPMKGRFGERW